MKVYIVGIPSSGKRTLVSLMHFMAREIGINTRVIQGASIVNKIMAYLQAGKWPPPGDGKRVVIEFFRRERRNGIIRVDVRDIGTKIDDFSTAFILDADVIIFVVDFTQDVNKQMDIYENLFSIIDKKLRGYKGIVAVTKCNSGKVEVRKWLMEQYPIIGSRGYPVYGIRFYTEGNLPAKPPLAEDAFNLLYEILGNSVFRKRESLENMNMDKHSKEFALKTLKHLNALISLVFKKHPDIGRGYERRYREYFNRIPLIYLLMVAKDIYREIPRGEIEKSELKSYIIRICETIYKSTNRGEFLLLRDDILSYEVSVDAKKIDFQLSISGKLMKNEAKMATLTIKNGNPNPVEIEIGNFSSENATIKTQTEKIKLVREANIEVIITPTVAGDIPLKLSGKVSAGSSEDQFSKMFLLKAYEKEKKKIVEVTPEATPEAPVPVSPEKEEGKIEQTPSPAVSYDPEKLLRKGTTQEWLKIVENSIEEDRKIDLLNAILKIDPLEKRGYRNLLKIAFLIDLQDYSPQEVLKIFNADSFTLRAMEILMNLRRKGEVSLSPNTSDKSYIENALHILGGTYSLTPKEKREIKEWNIKIGDRVIKVKKEFNRESKRIIYRIE